MTARIPGPHPPAVRPSRFSHLVVKTGQLPAMAAWYKTLLNAQPLYENAQVCFLTFDDGPDPEGTPHVLDVPKAHDVRAESLVQGGNP